MRLTLLLGVWVGALVALGAADQRTDVFVASRDHPAIAYSRASTTDPVAVLNARLEKGEAKLAFDQTSGYLRATLDALQIPVESQMLVLSQTSAQAERISPANPRAIFFNDTAAVGWVRGADLLEVASQDPRQGTIFYTLRQSPDVPPIFARNNGCLECHLTWDTLGVPGVFMLSTFPMIDDPTSYASGFTADDRSPVDQRFGGWYVTGKVGSPHMGNQPVLVKPKAPRIRGGRPLDTVAAEFDTSGYLSKSSDIVALMTLQHQTHMANLITRVGWEARVAAAGRPGDPPAPRGAGEVDRVEEAAIDLVDYLLFVDEAPLAGHVAGTSGFAEKFSAMGPRDGKGRSLRQFDLDRRLLKYPCSYMIYSPAFDALPPSALDAVYRRLWAVISGDEKQARYMKRPAADRRAIVEILRETKKNLPDYFKAEAVH